MLTPSVNDTLRAAQDALAGIHALHRRIRELESRLKKMQTRSEHWREIAAARDKEITRLKKGLKP